MLERHGLTRFDASDTDACDAILWPVRLSLAYEQAALDHTELLAVPLLSIQKAVPEVA